MKTLGICIPTYRRPHFLARCLHSIIGQAQGLALRIFVADDSCSEVNRVVIEDASARFGQLVYEVNPCNLGINENIRRVVEISDTDYVWLVGEDDVFLPGAVGRAFAHVQACEGPFVFCNYAFSGDDGVVGARAWDIHADTVVEAQEFVRHRLWATGFMGACLFELSAWRRVASDRYRGTYYAHVGHIVEMLRRPTQVISVLAAPLIANRAGNPEYFTWRTDALGVFLGFERMCGLAAEVVPALAPALEQAAVTYRGKQNYLSPRALARMRADGIVDRASYRIHLKNMKLPPATRILILAMLVLPRVLFTTLLALKRGVRSG